MAKNPQHNYITERVTEGERDFNLYLDAFGNVVHRTFMPIKRIIERKKGDTKIERDIYYIFI